MKKIAYYCLFHQRVLCLRNELFIEKTAHQVYILHFGNNYVFICYLQSRLQLTKMNKQINSK